MLNEIKIKFYDDTRILSSTNETIVERKLEGRNNNMFPTGKYYGIQDMINEIAIKNKMSSKEIYESNDFNLLENKWSSYLEKQIDLFLHNRIFNYTLTSFTFHKEKTPLIVSQKLGEDDGIGVINFYSGEIHCFLSYINENGEINFNIENYKTEFGNRKSLIANIEKKLFSLKELPISIEYKNKKYLNKIIFHPCIHNCSCKITNFDIFNEVVGINELKKINKNLKIKNTWGMEDHFEMIYDTTLFDQQKHKLKKYTYVEPKFKIFHHDKVLKKKYGWVEISKITGIENDRYIYTYNEFKKWAYSFKWKKRDDFLLFMNDLNNDFPIGIPRNPGAYFSNIGEFSWLDALGVKPGYYEREKDEEIIRKYCIDENIKNYLQYCKMYDNNELPPSFPKMLNKFEGYVSYPDFVGNRDYSKLLLCKNRKEAQKKHNGMLQKLHKTKDKKLILKYTGHFKIERVKSYTENTLNKFFNSLSPNVYPDHNNKGMCEKKGIIYDKDYNGMYRAIFNRGKDKWYNRILEKWKNNVPMLFLKDDDKLKKIKKEIKLCENYTQWCKNYKSSHNDILVRLKQTHLLDILEKQHDHNHTEEKITKLLKNYKGKYYNDFRNDYNAEYCWLIDRKELKNKLFIECGLIEDSRWTKRKNRKIS
jgi:hypothetical protein